MHARVLGPLRVHGAKTELTLAGGTEGSNPSSSASESCRNSESRAVSRSLGSERAPKGEITLEDACRRMRLRFEDFATWESEVRRGAHR